MNQQHPELGYNKLDNPHSLFVYRIYSLCTDRNVVLPHFPNTIRQTSVIIHFNLVAREIIPSIFNVYSTHALSFQTIFRFFFFYENKRIRKLNKDFKCLKKNKKPVLIVKNTEYWKPTGHCPFASHCKDTEPIVSQSHGLHPSTENP